MSAPVTVERRRHTVRGGVFGFLFGAFLGLDLFALGVVPSDSVLVTILPLLGLVGGIVLGRTTPLGRRTVADGTVVAAQPEPVVHQHAHEQVHEQPQVQTPAIPDATAVQTPSTPAGWYRPEGETRLRWWDGTKWTDDYSE